MGFIILGMGVELAWGALEELIDTGLDEALVVAVQETLQATAGAVSYTHLDVYKRQAVDLLMNGQEIASMRLSASLASPASCSGTRI